MKTAAMVTVAAMLGGVAWAAAESGGREVVACIEMGPDRADREAAAARTAAARLFLRAGVKLEWHLGPHFCQAHKDQAIMVSLSMNTPKDLLPGALAYALPYEGVHIRVFYDRMAGAKPDLRRHLLAYVLVHEITHVLERTVRHSDSGIMKARWDDEDFRLMPGGGLRFTVEDIELLHAGLAARATRPAPGVLVAYVTLP
jgi:hypothetical protein